MTPIIVLMGEVAEQAPTISMEIKREDLKGGKC
jgi:hypothetical protein